MSSLFEDHEFCVMSGSADFTKHELEKKIAEVETLSVSAFIQTCQKTTESRHTSVDYLEQASNLCKSITV